MRLWRPHWLRVATAAATSRAVQCCCTRRQQRHCGGHSYWYWPILGQAAPLWLLVRVGFLGGRGSTWDEHTAEAVPYPRTQLSAPRWDAFNISSGLVLHLSACSGIACCTMKFSAALQAETDETFRAHYLRYNALKDILRAVTPAGAEADDMQNYIRTAINRRLTPNLRQASAVRHSFLCRDAHFAYMCVFYAQMATAVPEVRQFMDMLEADLQSVGRFVADHKQDLHMRARALVARASGSLSSSEIMRLETSVDELAALVVKLDRFCLLNYTGFIKLVKKHDRLTQHSTLPWLLTRLSNDGSFMQHRFDTLVTSLSDAYAALRARRAGASGKPAAAWVPPSNFERSTTKYWVAPEDVVAVKCALVKHLPVLIFGRPDGAAASSAADSFLVAAGNTAAGGEPPSDCSSISSVYFDNAALDVYRTRLLREEGATLVRLRWYGDSVGADTEVWIERKTHHESWTIDCSVKERFRLKAKHVAAFLAGELDMETLLKKLKADGASDADIARTRTLAAEVAQEVSARQLTPALRTMYFRTAFQLSTSNAVRVSLDTQLRMLDERTPASVRRQSWHRPLDDKQHPVAPHELVEFPFAVLEVKLQDEMPKWMAALLDSGRLTQCTKYSKFLHGTASLRVNAVERLPHWWDDPSVVPSSALAAVTQGAGPPRAASMASLGAAETGSVDDLAALPHMAGKKELRSGLKRSMSAPPGCDAAVVAIAPSGDTPRGDTRGGLVRRLSRALGSTAAGGVKEAQAGSQGSKLSLGPVPKLHVPIRIEPKTFFANERTLLNYLHLSILILFTSLSLVTNDSMMGGEHLEGSWGSDYNSRLAGAIMAPVAVLFILYALTTFMWRANRIARREPCARYDDRFGPCVLVTLLLGVVVTTIVLAITHADWHRNSSVELVVNSKHRNSVMTVAVAAANKTKAASLLRLNTTAGSGCSLLRVEWPPFFRPRGVAVMGDDTLLVGGEYQLVAVSPPTASVRVLPAADTSVSAVAALPNGDVYLGSARPRNWLVRYDIAAGAVAHGTSLDGDVLLGATQTLSALAAGPNRTLLVTGANGVEVLSMADTAVRNATAPLVWSAVRHLDGDALSFGLQGSAHIGGMALDDASGIFLLLFDKAKPPTVRSWNMTSGQLLGDWPLPAAAVGPDSGEDSAGEQSAGALWTGLALGRDSKDLFVVRASVPPQLWRLRVGQKLLPSCIL